MRIEQREGKWWAERDGEWVKCHELEDGTFELPIEFRSPVQPPFFIGMVDPRDGTPKLEEA